MYGNLTAFQVFKKWNFDSFVILYFFFTIKEILEQNLAKLVDDDENEPRPSPSSSSKFKVFIE